MIVCKKAKNMNNDHKGQPRDSNSEFQIPSFLSSKMRSETWSST